MKSIATCAAALTLWGACVQACFGQTEADPLTRREVKEQTRAAERAHQLTPAGEGSSPVPKREPRSTYTRAERKSTTLQARRSGDLFPAGDGGFEEKIAKDEARAPRSTRTRAQRKAETRAAAKAHQLIPAGEGPGSPSK
jgi:hypothetical protein